MAAADDQLVALIVRIKRSELAALSHVAVVVTSAAELAVVNAAEAGLRRVREAAVQHLHRPSS